MKPLDASWQGWVKLNLERGCDPERIAGILLKHQFAIASIREHMGASFPVDDPQVMAAEGRAANPIDYAAIAATRITRWENGAKPYPTDKVQLYTLPDFLDAAECTEALGLINQQLRPSTVTRGSDDKYRTSRTSDLSQRVLPFTQHLDDKISRTLGIRIAYSEATQAQRYDPGEEFKQHTDYFEPGTDEYVQHTGRRGQRTWTFMVYLNDVERGGATRFFSLDKDFVPRRGLALIWNSLHRDGRVNRDTLHAGLPVEAGVKFIITKWFRERGYGPMFYGD
jgi:prolyl 4-hydroxylase